MGAKEKRVQGYNAGLYWSLTNRCNLDCTYCITACSDKKTASIPKIDISSFIATLEKANRIFKISFIGGGEPFLVPNLVEACIEITKKHYVAFNTNLTTSQIKKFAGTIDPNRVTRIVASVHIKELEKRKLLRVYIDNFLLLKERGFDIGAKAVAYPALLKEIKKYKQFFKENKIELGFVPFFGNYAGKKYPFSYTRDELEDFGLNQSANIKELGLHQSHKLKYRRHKVCNAGYNAGEIDAEGNVYICQYIKMRMGHIYKDIEFRSGIIICPFKSFCRCALYKMDTYLFEKAQRECEFGHQKLGFYHLCSALIYEKIDKILGLFGLFLKAWWPQAYIRCRNFYDKHYRYKP